MMLRMLGSDLMQLKQEDSGGAAPTRAEREAPTRMLWPWRPPIRADMSTTPRWGRSAPFGHKAPRRLGEAPAELKAEAPPSIGAQRRTHWLCSGGQLYKRALMRSRRGAEAAQNSGAGFGLAELGFGQASVQPGLVDVTEPETAVPSGSGPPRQGRRAGSG